MSDSTQYTSKLAGTRILVIGGSSGIGFTVASACIEHFAHVVISSSNPSRVDTAVKKIRTAYPSKTSNIHGITVDLGNPSSLESELKSVLENSVQQLGGKLDHVIYTAGDSIANIKLADMTYEKIVKAGQIRFFAPLLLAKYLPDYLAQSYTSSYTLTTGSVSEKPIPDWSVTGSYAGGLHSMVRNLALDMKPIRVNGVSPGAVDTELWNVSGEQREKMMSAVGEKLATGRVGRPEDVAESYLGVLKDGNMTGGMIRTDGGGLFM
jgi:NAD(P)-dependent dehydrogenase (short-subunit alcohol dehydrogenase family)